MLMCTHLLHALATQKPQGFYEVATRKEAERQAAALDPLAALKTEAQAEQERVARRARVRAEMEEERRRQQERRSGGAGGGGAWGDV